MSDTIHGNTCFCAYSLKIYMKAQKHECFHVFSHSSLTLTGFTVSSPLRSQLHDVIWRSIPGFPPFYARSTRPQGNEAITHSYWPFFLALNGFVCFFPANINSLLMLHTLRSYMMLYNIYIVNEFDIDAN